MPNYNRQNIDRKTNKPYPTRTEGITDDQILNRAEQTRRDDDVIRTPQRTAYDIDYAIKWYIENEIRPQVTVAGQLHAVPVIFANGEKWDNVRRLGYLRDEKGMLQSPVIMLKRNSIVERDTTRGLDVNRQQPGNHIIGKSKYNARNRYEDTLFPMPIHNTVPSEQLFVLDIPKYVTIMYDIMLWCDFTTQMNELVDQILPFNRFSWGNEGNKFPVSMAEFSFETVNTIGEDRLVRCTNSLTVLGTLLSAHETRLETIKKMYSIKKVSFDIVVNDNIFQTTTVPVQLLASRAGTIVINNIPTQIVPSLMNYLINLTDQLATYVNPTIVTVNAYAAINPTLLTIANVNEFDVYINGQYIDKICYTWTPSDVTTQTIVFDTTILGYTIDATDAIIINGRWA